jgi:hypothetical protein
MEQLQQEFNLEVHKKEAVLAFIHAFIAEEGVKRMYERKEVAHIADAKELIDGAFDALEQVYGIKDKPDAPTNVSR